ncbi:hypothetical protein JXA48_03125 [Candidatus Woesearchaeota archaeon]|nr:hypothetical protein [Candidatus Woesearchaeota archaeon]
MKKLFYLTIPLTLALNDQAEIKTSEQSLTQSYLTKLVTNSQSINQDVFEFPWQPLFSQEQERVEDLFIPYTTGPAGGGDPNTDALDLFAPLNFESNFKHRIKDDLQRKIMLDGQKWAAQYDCISSSNGVK